LVYCVKKDLATLLLLRREQTIVCKKRILETAILNFKKSQQTKKVEIKRKIPITLCAEKQKNIFRDETRLERNTFFSKLYRRLKAG
jgi:hypothetical protein